MPKRGFVLAGIPGVEGEKVFLAAILQQAIADLDAANPVVRKQAYRFLRDRQAVFQLTDLLNLEHGTVGHLLDTLLGERLRQAE